VPAPVFIGDEVSASAWRLVGARTIVADRDAAAGALDAVPGDTQLLLITAACAAGLDSGRLEAAVRRARPMVLVVPDAANRLAPPDLDSKVDRVLGIEQ
jgi:vacuolar-type H+-ATPase subunit F/Vma7